jgi:hypothetical protein
VGGPALVRGRVSFEWLEDGHFLIQRMATLHAGSLDAMTPPNSMASSMPTRVVCLGSTK